MDTLGWVLTVILLLQVAWSHAGVNLRPGQGELHVRHLHEDNGEIALKINVAVTGKHQAAYVLIDRKTETERIVHIDDVKKARLESGISWTGYFYDERYTYFGNARFNRDPGHPVNWTIQPGQKLTLLEGTDIHAGTFITLNANGDAAPTDLVVRMIK